MTYLKQVPMWQWTLSPILKMILFCLVQPIVVTSVRAALTMMAIFNSLYAKKEHVYY